MQVASWLLLAVGVVMVAGGLIYDMANNGDEEVNLVALYLAGTFLCVLAVFAGSRAKKLRS